MSEQNPGTRGAQPTPTGASQPSGGPPAGRPRNAVAVAAFAVGLVGSIFGVVRGVQVVGWVLLPIGFILSIVALAQVGKPKRLAVWALVVVVVGSIAAAIVFTSTTAVFSR